MNPFLGRYTFRERRRENQKHGKTIRVVLEENDLCD